jgi:hypothetical protein
MESIMTAVQELAETGARLTANKYSYGTQLRARSGAGTYAKQVGVISVSLNPRDVDFWECVSDI